MHCGIPTFLAMFAFLISPSSLKIMIANEFKQDLSVYTYGSPAHKVAGLMGQGRDNLGLVSGTIACSSTRAGLPVSLSQTPNPTSSHPSLDEAKTWYIKPPKRNVTLRRRLFHLQNASFISPETLKWMSIPHSHVCKRRCRDCS